MTSDSELLRQYAEGASEDAFRELVERHLPLVFSAALRQGNGDMQMAQDVAQSVFTDLAKKARRLQHYQFVSGWLYTRTRFAAANWMRTERRRFAREKEAQNMNELLSDTDPSPDWEALRPVLDEAICRLRPADRDLVIIRYFQNQPWPHIAKRFGLSEDAARKRGERALERLRALLAGRGIASTAALAGVLPAYAIQAVPPNLVAAISAASLAGATATTAGYLATTALMTTKLKLALLGTAAALAIAIPAIHGARLRSRITDQNTALKRQGQEIANLSEQLRAQASAPNESPDAELLRLRSEVGLMRRQLAETSNKLAMVQRRPKTSELEQFNRELEQYYQTHRTNYWQAESVQLNVIALSKGTNPSPSDLENVREQAASIQTRLAAGADFYTAARQYSQDSQAKSGGDWGWVEKGVLRKELEDVVFLLNEGQISPVIETPESFFIARILARREGQFKSLWDAYRDVLKGVIDERRSADAAMQE